jgi:lipid-A-disaccharide synthase
LAEYNRIFIIAGETSGDLHASHLIQNIKSKFNNISFYGIGGQNLESNGVKLIFNYKELNYIGFGSVLKNILKLKKIFNTTLTEIRKLNPDIIILVDFPGFNLRIANKLRKFYKGKIIYYISPQLWAWNKSRVSIIRNSINKILVVFPFEVDFYRKEGIEADFVGHPLKEKITNFLNSNKKEKKDKIQITLLPGSRIEEIKKILPIMAYAAIKLKNKFNAELNILCSENIDVSLIKNTINSNSFKIFKKNSADDEINYKILSNSDFVITKSGTSTLECCLLEAPFCLVYNTSYFNYLIARALITVKYLSIVNILAQKEVVKEFIQQDFNSENIFNEGVKIITNIKYVETMKDNFRTIRNNLFNKKIDSKAEDIICKYLK